MKIQLRDLTRVALCAGLVFVSACTLHAAELRASPNINFDGKGRHLALDLDSSVPDKFTVHSSVASGPVDGWRTALTDAFHKGFKSVFVLDDGHPDMTLQILETDVVLTPAAVNANGSAVAAQATIRYKATLKEGEKGYRFAGEGVSDPGTVFGDIFRSALERLFEDIAQKAFAARQASAK